MLAVPRPAPAGTRGAARTMTFLQLLLFAATAYNLALVLFILRNTHARQTGRLFAWFILSTAAWNADVALLQFPAMAPVAIWLVRATFVIAVFMSWSGLWFCVEFPQRSTRFRRVAVALTALGLPWLIASWFPQMIPTVSLQAWGVKAEIGMLVTPFTIWILICIILSVAHLVMKARVLRGLERAQVHYVILGIAGLALFGTLSNLVLPAVSKSNDLAPLGGLSSLFLTTTATYAIARYRLLDLQLVLRTGLIYSITLAVLSLPFALLVPLLERALTHSLDVPSGVGSFLLAFAIALVFQPVRTTIQGWVDLRFFKSVYDFRATLREAGDALAGTTSRQELLQRLVHALSTTLRPSCIAVYLPERDGRLVLVSDTAECGDLPQAFHRGDPLPYLAQATDDVILADELRRRRDGTAHEVGMQLVALGVLLVIPLQAGGHLSGLIALGEKRSGDMYTADDLRLLRILGTQAAVALDNVRHYEEMVALNAYHARLLQTMQDGVIAIDPQGRVITFNEAAARILEVEHDTARFKQLAEIGLSGLPLDALGESGADLLLTTRTGRQVPALVTVTPFIRRWDVEQSHLVVLRDLTTLRELEQQKVQAERFSSMGAMAASLAHGIKNPLVPIKTFAQLLPVAYDDAEFRKDFSQTVLNEVERINALVGQMLDLVRKPSSQQRCVHLGEVIESLLVLIRPQCERQEIALHTEIPDTLPATFGQEGQLYQSLLNVLTNAVQAMPNGGTLHITLTGDSQQIVCRIADTGPGVPPEKLPHIFEPLFTTKADGHGLGLSLTYRFVRANGGEIRADSPPGTGLIVTIVLPAWRRQEAELLCS